MTRLIDELDLNDPKQAHARSLLGAGGPLRESEVSRQRVLRALQKNRRAAGPRRVQPAVAAAILFALAGTAGAAWGVARYVSANDNSGSAVAPATSHQSSAAELKALGTKTAKSPAPANDVPETGLAAAEPNTEQATAGSVQVQQAPERGDPPTRASVTGPSRAKGPIKPESGAGDLVLLHQATEALRASDDPEKAARLLREYEQVQKSGALDEEVLALRVEAALANHDPQAAALGRRYLAKYPGGRFAALATRAASTAQ